MKKFQFAAGALALGLLASCSSDAPEMPNNQPADDGEAGMYIAINVVGDNTRDDNEKAGEKESFINEVQLFLVEAGTNKQILKVTSEPMTNSVAKFKVNTSVYNDLKGRVANGEEFDVYVYCNGKNVTLPNLLATSTNDLRNGDDNYFIMSNAVVSGKGSGMGVTLQGLTGADDEGTLGNPWTISEDIKVARLAARFDYDEKKGNNYTATYDSDVVMHVAGIDVNTFATNTYRLPQFSADGTKTNMAPFPGAGRTYAVTDVNIVENPEEDDNYMWLKDHKYTIRPAAYKGTTSYKEYDYERPNTIRKSTTTPLFTHTPYAAIRAEFTSTRCKASMDAGKELFVINGMLVGGVAELKALKAEGKEFKIEAAETEQEHKDAVAKVNKAVNDALKLFTPSTNADEDKAYEEDYKRLFDLLPDQKEIYKPSAVSGKYYTYYSQFIVHDSNASEACKKYGVFRNYVYKLGVNSFHKLGNNGDVYPGNDPEEADLTDMAISLTLSVDTWKLKTNTWDL